MSTAIGQWRVRSLSHAWPSHGQVWYRVQAGGAGAVLAPGGGGHCLLLAEPGAGFGHLGEPVWVLGLADLVGQLGLALAEHRPRPEPDSPLQAVGRPGQQRRLLGVAFGEGQPREGGQAQGQAAGAVCLNAAGQGVIEQLAGLI
jgi:hypothetical protein